MAFYQLEKNTLENDLYRRVVETVEGKFQLVLMALLPEEDIPRETHDGVQFFHVRAGRLGIMIDEQTYYLETGETATVPPGSSHYVWNAGSEIVKLYTIYTPPEHDPDRIDWRQLN